ncbi:11765_t:CDS:2 [Paraglomus brasilianum]|uniref:11765_t:CDS:1 n=1 Tax=Paraglomus brasilianum TaxID=144538 RepID=A0A9N9G349_9GLOM|nr:11765_t:CDS:2 [Paraglomus brasilianum]
MFSRPCLSTRLFNPTFISLFTRSKSTKSTKIIPLLSTPRLTYNPPPRLAIPENNDTRPSAGRTVPVTYNIVNAAYRRLSIILSQNNLRREIRRTMAYEKPTVKRKRINKMLNRKKFAAVVGKKIALVLQMKHRGI